MAQSTAAARWIPGPARARTVVFRAQAQREAFQLGSLLAHIGDYGRADLCLPDAERLLVSAWRALYASDYDRGCSYGVGRPATHHVFVGSSRLGSTGRAASRHPEPGSRVSRVQAAAAAS